MKKQHKQNKKRDEILNRQNQNSNIEKKDISGKQILQFPNSELMAKKIKAEVMKNARSEFAIVMAQLNESGKKNNDQSDLPVV